MEFISPKLDRKNFLKLATGLTTGVLLSGSSLIAASKTPLYKAIAFDAFPIFDPRPVFKLTEQLFPAVGAELSATWRSRQFEYCWLRCLSGRYEDFWKVTQDALVFAAKTVKVELPVEQRDRLMQAYRELKAWPDVLPALQALKAKGMRLAFLSNFTGDMLESAIGSAGLNGQFEMVISTDMAKTYKPDPRAYQLGVDLLGLKKEDILFVAFAGWDAAGAKSYGYPTFWVNRLGSPPEELSVLPDASGAHLDDLIKYLE